MNDHLVSVQTDAAGPLPVTEVPAPTSPYGGLRWKVGRVARRLTSPLRPLPDFLLIGAQKSGTTTLFDYLAQHPLVRPPRTKEVHYFDYRYRKGTFWYRSNFPLAGPTGSRAWVTGEASPLYLFHPLVAERAAALVPGARLVVVLRHPVDRAYSHYQHERARGREPLTFEAAVTREVERTSGAWERLRRGADREVAAERFSYLARGRYAEQLERWLACYPREQLLVLRAEDLFHHPDAVLPGVLRHLGLDPDQGMVFRRLHARSYPPMTDALKERLREYYRGPIRDLETLVGRDFGWQL